MPSLATSLVVTSAVARRRRHCRFGVLLDVPEEYDCAILGLPPFGMEQALPTELQQPSLPEEKERDR